MHLCCNWCWNSRNILLEIDVLFKIIGEFNTEEEDNEMGNGDEVIEAEDEIVNEEDVWIDEDSRKSLIRCNISSAFSSS